MVKKLVILLDQSDLSASMFVSVTTDGIISAPSYCTAEALADVKSAGEVIVLVPSAAVLLLAVTLPVMPRAKLLQALPFALEEHLVGDIETQHIVPLSDAVGGEVSAAVVSHETMRLWLDQISIWGLKADYLLPVCLALPDAASSWQAAYCQTMSVRTGKYAGFGCDQAVLSLMLSGAVSAAKETPDSFEMNNYTDKPFDSSQEMPVLLHETMRDAAQYFADLTVSLGEYPAVNLLQGKYAAKKSRLPRVKKIGQLALIFSVVWAGLLFLYPAVSYFILKSRLASINDQIAVIYHREFPNAANVVAPKMRMEEKLHAVTSSLGSNRFLWLTSLVGKSMLSAPSLHLKRMQFQQNRLTLEVNASSVADFTAFTSYLQHEGLKVKQQNANLADARVTAVVEVE